MTDIVLIAHNLRSCHNVGSLLRTAEGLGISQVYLTGYTPYPERTGDTRLPHLARRIHNRIVKTSLGAETTQSWQQTTDIDVLLTLLRSQGYVIAAVEQSGKSIPLPGYHVPPKIALIVGREVEGIEDEVLDQCDIHLEIPMSGQKESFNVIQAAAMAMYHCTFSRSA
jgi:tRNA G18 (ribose-2'-O)-methylase SpoU